MSGDGNEDARAVVLFVTWVVCVGAQTMTVLKEMFGC